MLEAKILFTEGPLLRCDAKNWKFQLGCLTSFVFYVRTKERHPKYGFLVATQKNASRISMPSL